MFDKNTTRLLVNHTTFADFETTIPNHVLSIVIKTSKDRCDKKRNSR